LQQSTVLYIRAVVGLDQHRQTLVLNIYLYQYLGSGFGRTEFFYDEFMLHRLEKDFHIFLKPYITIVLI